MHFILIVWIYAWNYHLASMATAEYNSKEACVQAGENFRSMDEAYKYTCSEKGGL